MKLNLKLLSEVLVNNGFWNVSKGKLNRKKKRGKEEVKNYWNYLKLWKKNDGDAKIHCIMEKRLYLTTKKTHGFEEQCKKQFFCVAVVFLNCLIKFIVISVLLFTVWFF